MNKRGNIALDQQAFNNLISYASELEDKRCINFIKEFSAKRCYFKADYNEQGDISIIAINHFDDNPIGAFHLSVDSGIDANYLLDRLFHQEQRVPDYED